MWIQDLKNIYCLYPRRFFTTKSWEINSFEEFLECFRNNVSTSRCSSSIYNFGKDDTQVVLDRIAFDLDNERSHSEAIALHNYFLDQDIKHYLVFSGKNFHIYAKVVGTPIFKKDCLKNMHMDIETKLGIENDISIRGNIRHNLSIPYSYNFKRKRYVRFINETELNMEPESLSELAKRQGGQLVFYGTEGIDCSPFDREIKIQMEEIEEIDNSEFVSDKLMNALPDSVKKALQNPNLEHPDRLLLITRLFEFGLSKTKIIKILRDHLTEKKFHHCVFEERQVDNVFRSKYKM